MGLLRSVGWLVVAAGCAATTTPPTTETRGQCTPSATSAGSLHLVGIGPDVVPLHGGDVELSFDGEVHAPIYVNGKQATLAGTTLHVPATEAGNGPLSIRVGTQQDPVATLECAGHYESAPDDVSLATCTSGQCEPLPGVDETMAIPMHPELAHECARTGQIAVTNNGDWGMQIVPILTGSPGFETVFPDQACPLPLDHDSCQIVMCFSSTIADVHHAHLEVPSTAATASLDFTATVLPATPGLAFARWRPYAYAPRGVATLPGGGIAVWDDAPAQSFDLLLGNGASTPISVAPLAVRTLRAGAAGQGIYAIVGAATSHGDTEALVHFDDTGVPDPAFAEVALDGDAYVAHAAVQIGANQVFAIGATTVRAMTSAGALQTVIDFSARGSFTGASALDASGRLYVATSGGVIRIAGGQIDPTFAFSRTVAAMTLAADAPLVAVGGTLVQLDAAGTATPVIAPALGPIVDVAVDASGRLDVVFAGGELVRFTAAGALDGVQGFDGARHVACPASGGCAAIGVANGVDKYALQLVD